MATKWWDWMRIWLFVYDTAVFDVWNLMNSFSTYLVMYVAMPLWICVTENQQVLVSYVEWYSICSYGRMMKCNGKSSRVALITLHNLFISVKMIYFLTRNTALLERIHMTTHVWCGLTSLVPIFIPVSFFRIVGYFALPDPAYSMNIPPYFFIFFI